MDEDDDEEGDGDEAIPVKRGHVMKSFDRRYCCHHYAAGLVCYLGPKCFYKHVHVYTWLQNAPGPIVHFSIYM